MEDWLVHHQLALHNQQLALQRPGRQIQVRFQLLSVQMWSMLVAEVGGTLSQSYPYLKVKTITLSLNFTGDIKMQEKPKSYLFFADELFLFGRRAVNAYIPFPPQMELHIGLAFMQLLNYWFDPYELFLEQSNCGKVDFLIIRDISKTCLLAGCMQLSLIVQLDDLCIVLWVSVLIIYISQPRWQGNIVQQCATSCPCCQAYQF